MLSFLPLSFFAGMLTVLAPCILPVLPVIIGGAISDKSTKRRPWLIILSLVISIVLFTLLLKWSTSLINIPQSVWQWVSGGILILFSLTMILPGLWEKIPGLAKVSSSSNALLGKGYQRKGIAGDIIMGAALGPVFSSCSPTYFVILAAVLPASFIDGLINLFAYALGLGLVLLLISFLGQKLVTKLGIVANPRGWFKRIIGILFLLVGIFIISGLDKVIQTRILQGDGIYTRLTNVENKLIDSALSDMDIQETTAPERTVADSLENMSSPRSEDLNDMPQSSAQTDMSPVAQFSSAEQNTQKVATYLTPQQKSEKYKKYVEITGVSGYVNTNDVPFTLEEYVGKKIILVDFMTYSCINCIRTFPYLNTWYETYEDEGFIIVGIHTPEFAFEKKKENVEQALSEYGIRFPVVLDNNYATWRAWGNRYWPRKYLIDVDGYVVYDHIGEGAYEETEEKIVQALNELKARNQESAITSAKSVSNTFARMIVSDQTPEIYFGTLRNAEYVDRKQGDCTRTKCAFDYDALNITQDTFSLQGDWEGKNEFVLLEEDAGGFGVHFMSGKVFLVASSSDRPIQARLFLDGKSLPEMLYGKDVDANGIITIQESRLYELVNLGNNPGKHVLELRTDNGKGLEIYTLTFGK